MRRRSTPPPNNQSHILFANFLFVLLSFSLPSPVTCVDPFYIGRHEASRHTQHMLMLLLLLLFLFFPPLLPSVMQSYVCDEDEQEECVILSYT